MPPKQVVPRPCGCVDELWGWRQGPIGGQEVYTTLCAQHLFTANNPGSRQQPNMTSPQMQTSTTIPGIPSHPFFPHQMGGFGHPFQMPPQGVHIRMPQPGTGR